MESTDRCVVCGATEYVNVSEYSKVFIPGQNVHLTMCVYCSCSILSNVLASTKCAPEASEIMKNAIYEMVVENAEMDATQNGEAE